MADPYKLQVLKALCSHLEGITAANGYNYDLTNAVFRGRTIFGDSDPIPMLSVLESPRAVPGAGAGEHQLLRYDEWELLVQGWTHDDPINPTDPVYPLLDAVEKRLSEIVKIKSDGSGRPVNPATYRLGGLIGDLKFGPGIVRPPTDGVSSKAFFYLPVRVHLAANVG